jgi:hypothetical protein
MSGVMGSKAGKELSIICLIISRKIKYYPSPIVFMGEGLGFGRT